MTILVAAGDPSGDLHGAHLIRALRKQHPGIRIAAIGGPLMKEEADEFLEDLASRGVTGFWEPIGKLGFLLRLALRVRRYLRERRPEALVCIDYYGFNRRLLGLAKAAGVPAYYYISPQVWASRPGRIKTLKRLVRRMFVIFPFEEALYKKAGVPCSFVGHPLLDLVPEPAASKTLKVPLTVALLPGSRASEVRRHLPIFLEGFQLLRRHFPQARALIFAADNLADRHYYAGLAASAIQDVEIVRDRGYARRASADLAICSSGTATLENALLGLPMVVVYKLSWPTYVIARAIIQVRFIAMANILAGRALVPELIQHKATPARLAQAACAILEDPRRYHAMRGELRALRKSLGAPGAAQRTAKEIVEACRSAGTQG